MKTGRNVKFLGLILGLAGLACLSNLVGCAGDIKGEKGEDATAEAVIALHRPEYRSSPLSTSTVVVLASNSLPAKVLIGGIVYTNSTDAGCDISTSGRGGLDTDSVAALTAYYLFAIPAESGLTFELVASATPPSTGPTGFSEWSYIGAFITNASQELSAFSSSRGFLIIQGGGAYSTTETTTINYEKKTLAPYPVTVKRHWGRIVISGTGVGYPARVAGFNVGSPYEALVVRLQAENVENWVYGFVPATENPDIWIQSSNATNTARWSVYGWEEDPAEWP